MDIDPFIEQLKKNIGNLLAEKRYREAFNLCNEAISKYPDIKSLYVFKKDIEDSIREENKKVIKERLADLKPLWEKENYVEILGNLRSLLKLDPDNEELKKQYFKAEKSYQKQLKELQEKFEKAESKKLEDLLQKNEQELIMELFNLERESPGNQTVLHLTGIFRNKIIQKRIKDAQDLIYSEKYDVIENFINELKKIDAKNPLVLNLEKTTRERKLGGQLEEKGEFVYKGEEHLNTLMKLKKYDKAIQVAQELLEIDKSNQRIYKILKKAEENFYKQTKTESIKLIEEKFPQIKMSYLKNKDQYIKI